MTTLSLIIVLIPALPLAGAVLAALCGVATRKEVAHLPVIVGVAGAFACSMALLFYVVPQTGPDESAYEITVPLWTWASVEDAYDLAGAEDAADFTIPIELRVDSLSAMMLAMVTFISTLVAVYSVGYMHDDPGHWRFFSYISLFVFSMTMLLLAANFLLLYVFWEAVGVCSYLLIGFWYEKPEAAAAGKKAFLVNRVGDFGFALGIFLIWTTFGSLSFQEVLTPEAATIGGGVLLAICLLLLVGACGKSAQFPLHVWLPDAMEGPTPVSALIHAATMVTAGVYMIARCYPLYSASPTAQLVVACIGGFTALLAALIALTQYDLKRVLAYSTISQLGYMFLALGAGTLAGTTAAMFHLFTHAFFKALLFLGAGSVMHAMGGVIDMRRFGGLRQVMPITHLTFAIGCVALAGLPPLAGFWSKDAAIAAVYEQAESPIYRLLFYASLLTGLLTAFYTFRAFFLTFYGEEVIPAEAHGHAHESPKSMWIPLALLAVCAAFAGLLAVRGDAFALSQSPDGFIRFLENSPSLSAVPLENPPAAAEHAEAHHDDGHTFVALMSTLAALIGLGAAAFLYLGDRREIEALARWMRLEGAEQWRGPMLNERLRNLAWGRSVHRAASAVWLGWLASLIGAVLRFLILLIVLPLGALINFSPYRLSERKFFFDEIYQALIVAPLRIFASFCAWFDRHVVDFVVDLVGKTPPALGRAVRPLQMGLVQFYALAMALGVVVMIVATMYIATKGAP